MFGLLPAAGRLWSTASPWPDPEPYSLWISDGTAAGTALLHGGANDWYVSDSHGILDGVGLGGQLWFAAGPIDASVRDGDGVPFLDQELWVSDGTTDGTTEAADINPDGSSFPRGFVRLGQTIIFSADDGEHGRELWSVAMP
jgi:ELWxxDGT repeat protein